MPELFQKTVKTLKLTEEKTLDLLKYETFAVPEALKKYRFKNFQGLASSFLIYGNEGTGKSGVLMQTIMYAHSRNWIVATLPSAYE